jgi:phage tail-like protein
VARSSNTDVLDTFRFQVSIDPGSNGNGPYNQMRAGFTECTAPSIDIEVKTYKEAGRHMNPRKITEGASFPDITLSRGVSTDSDFINWVQSVANLNNIGYSSNDTSNNRSTIKITQFDRTGTLVKTYVLYNCIPISLKIASDFNAMEDSISMETLKLAYEGFDILPNTDESLFQKAGGLLTSITNGLNNQQSANNPVQSVQQGVDSNSASIGSVSSIA